MSRHKGNLAEDKACSFLCENGFAIVERNYYSRFGEIDIIATKDKVLHFIEVKSGDDYEKAIQNITKSKLSKILKTSYSYIKKKDYDGFAQYDALIITESDIYHLENITI
jgi:putative endonuclease